MDRTEAIKVLDGMKVKIRIPNAAVMQNKRNRALDMAIKALEQEPCDDWYDIPSSEMTLEQARQAVRDLRKYVMDNHLLSEDAISRQAVLNIIASDWKYEGMEQCINDLPSVKPQEPTGHWIEEFNDLEGEVRFTCSSCGKYQLFETDYCYNCGARMIEPQERSENVT